ncbi:GTP-binding protein REM 1 isoform X3 [Podarcis raffonei]|uniref:GTP-binding protein REM 1 isoform X3 n=1 Tax=Podarcis raffonei TaxID=65483 RepID=UPI002329432D|nr:GTP-binding protein REM 1 isoform X3 [Podarcis raffonei]
MTLNTQRGGSASPARRRASTPLPMPYGSRPGMLSVRPSQAEPGHPQLGQSSSCDPQVHLPEPRGSWSSESSDSEESWGSLYRVVLLGDPGVGKTSLMYLFAGVQDKDLPEQQRGPGGRQLVPQLLHAGGQRLRHRLLHHRPGELRKRLRAPDPAAQDPSGREYPHHPGGEQDRPEGRACAVVFDCKFIETSAALQHNVSELFEGVVRQIRLRRDSKEANERRMSLYKRKESLTKKVRRFLDRLVARNNKKVALKVRSKSCHDLSVL